MAIADFQDLSAAIAAISVATERLVTIVKTAAPRLFAEEHKTDAKEVDLHADRWRRLRVLAVAFLCAWVTTGLLADTTASDVGWSFHPFGRVTVGSRALSVLFIALLATGGSAFWTQVVGYLGALKDVTQTAKATKSLAFQAQALDMGLTPRDSGIVARSAPGSVTAAQKQLLETLRKQPPTLAHP
jgi:hypothetical protein